MADNQKNLENDLEKMTARIEKAYSDEYDEVIDTTKKSKFRP